MKTVFFSLALAMFGSLLHASECRRYFREGEWFSQCPPPARFIVDNELAKLEREVTPLLLHDALTNLQGTLRSTSLREVRLRDPRSDLAHFLSSILKNPLLADDDRVLIQDLVDNLQGNLRWGYVHCGRNLCG